MCLSELDCCLVCMPNYLTFCCVYCCCIRGISENNIISEEESNIINETESDIEIII